MSNINDLLDDCENDLERISLIIDALGGTNNAVPYLTKYSIIKICGTLEQCFKGIIYEQATLSQNNQCKKYIEISFKESSKNPNMQNIFKSLKIFDDSWNTNFKSLLNSSLSREQIESSITSLNNARNEFAHGGNPTVTFGDLKRYFEDVKTIVSYIKSSVI